MPLKPSVLACYQVIFVLGKCASYSSLTPVSIKTPFPGDGDFLISTDVQHMSALSQLQGLNLLHCRSDRSSAI